MVLVCGEQLVPERRYVQEEGVRPVPVDEDCVHF